MSDCKLLTSQETAQFLRLSCETVRSLAVAGELPGVKIGRAWRFPRAALESFVLRTKGQRTHETVGNEATDRKAESVQLVDHNAEREIDALPSKQELRPPTSPIDAVSLLARCFGKLPFANSLLDELELTWKQRAQEIRELADRGDFEALAGAAHALKSAAAIVCATSVQGLASEIDQAGRSSNFERINALMAELSTEVKRCLDDLPRFRAELKERAAT